MEKLEDVDGKIRGFVVRMKREIDERDTGCSIAGKKYGVFLYLKDYIPATIDRYATECGDCTEERRREIEANLTELIRGIIDEVFEEEGK